MALYEIKNSPTYIRTERLGTKGQINQILKYYILMTFSDLKVGAVNGTSNLPEKGNHAALEFDRMHGL